MLAWGPELSGGATPARRPHSVQKRNGIRPMKAFISVGILDEQRSDPPCLVALSSSYAVQQLDRRPVMENLASDFQARHVLALCLPGMAIDHEFHGDVPPYPAGNCGVCNGLRPLLPLTMRG